jgi:transposase
VVPHYPPDTLVVWRRRTSVLRGTSQDGVHAAVAIGRHPGDDAFDPDEELIIRSRRTAAPPWDRGSPLMHQVRARHTDGRGYRAQREPPRPGNGERSSNLMGWPAPYSSAAQVRETGWQGNRRKAGAGIVQIAVLGIDLGKNSCSVVGLDTTGRVILKRRLHRDRVVKLAAGLPSCVMAMEACCGAHHLGRTLRDQGHEVRLMSPEYVRPYVKAQKNDDRDAEAIAEAATRPTMRFVELKSETQLDMQSLHRARDRLVGERTALINQLRAILLERGITMPQGRRKLELHLDTLLAGDTVPLSARTQLLVDDLRLEWRELDRRIEAFDAEFAAQARTDETARLLTTIPGIGPLNATALAAAIGNAQTFQRGRDLAAWLGLVPKQMTTGGKPKLLGINKRGNKYLRKMLIHGARAALPSLSKGETPMGGWLRSLLARAHVNTVVVALAAKLARIICAVLRSGRKFELVTRTAS